MTDSHHVLERIELADRETPFCECGRPTVLSGDASGVWLVCSSLQAPPRSGTLQRLLSIVTPGHTSRLIVDLDAEASQVEDAVPAAAA